MKLLVNAPSGKQEIIEVSEGGGYFDPARVLWDERVDGPLPEITLGAMVRVVDALQVDPGLAASTVAANQAAAAVQAREAAKQARTAAVEAITVTTTTGKVFDGNPQALQNLTSAYVVGTANNIAATQWTLADNSRVLVTLAEIKEAMTLSGLEISLLWALP